MKHDNAFEELKSYLKNLQYMYSLGGIMFSTHTTMIKCIRDYIDFLETKYE